MNCKFVTTSPNGATCRLAMGNGYSVGGVCCAGTCKTTQVFTCSAGSPCPDGGTCADSGYCFFGSCN
jgi:hypothetical protein